MHFDIRFLTLNLDRYGGKIVVLVLSILRVANRKRALYISCMGSCMKNQRADILRKNIVDCSVTLCWIS